MSLAFGAGTGLALPVDAAALVAAGPEWLTSAARAYGTLSESEQVAAITAVPFSGGNSGHKLLLSAHVAGEPAARALFVKFSRDFTDPFRDRRRFELEAEVHIARLSRHPGFPIAIPRPFFADFDPESGTGLVISERIAFGEAGIAPLHHKCMDHLLADPLDHYRALLTALARLAAADQAGRLAPDALRLFPEDRAALAADLPVAHDRAALRKAVADYADFAREAPRLLLPAITTPRFLARFEADARAFLAAEPEVRRFLAADPALTALAHWNCHIDNAWFFRDAAGELACGLMDWGMARRMNLGVAIWGSLSGMEPALLAEHCDALLAHFGQALAAAGGARIAPARLALHFDLAVMTVGMALLLDGPALVRRRLPRWREATGPLDPMLFTDEVARGFLHVFRNWLMLWEGRDFGRALARVAG